MKKIVYSPKYEVYLGNHPCDTKKYRLVKEKLDKQFSDINYIEPVKCSKEDLLLVHTKEYVDKVLNLKLTYDEILKLEIPLNKEIVEASLYCVKGTIIATELALNEHVGIHLGGGFHHAYSDHGEGFCIFNDLAIATRYVQKNFGVKKVAIIDCDLHQGNGTANIFKNDETVFTFSIHEEDIYPYPKENSSLDIGLFPWTGDNEYLDFLKEGLEKILSWGPEIIFYQAGVDPYEYDQLGNLKLTKDGLLKRDHMIKEYFNKIPIVVTLGGGYAFDINDTVELHYNTITTFIN